MTAIKICGIKEEKILDHCAHIGVKYIGLMFYRQSKRYVTLEIGAKLAKKTNNLKMIPVAVFVEQNHHEMQEVCTYCNIDHIQLHGTLPKNSHIFLPDNVKRIFVVSLTKDGKPNHKNDICNISTINKSRDFLLFDGIKGGSGKSISYAHIHKYSNHFRFFIAGGLSTSNVCKAIELCQPYGVDVSSNVENSNGLKDIKKITKFVQAVNTAVS